MTVNLPLLWPVVRTEMDHSPTLDIVVSPGISSHNGVSSILPIHDKGYWWRSRIFLTCRMKGETLVIMSCGSHWQTVVLLLKAKSCRFKNFSSHPLLAAKSSLLWWSSRALRWTAVLVTRRCCDRWCSVHKGSCSSMSGSFVFRPPPGRHRCLLANSKSCSLLFLQLRTHFSPTSYFLQLPYDCWLQQTGQPWD